MNAPARPEAPTSRVVVMTANGTSVDVTPAAEHLLNLARDAMPLRARATDPCPTAWAPLCHHLGRCNCQPCPAQVSCEAAACASTVDGKATVMVASSRPEQVAPLMTALAAQPDIEAWVEATAEPCRLAEALEARRADVLLIDQALFEAHDTRAVCVLRAHAAEAHVVVLSDRDTADLLDRIVGHGCRGLLQTKCPPAMIVKAIRAISRGELWLPRAWLARSAVGHAQTSGPSQGGVASSKPGSHAEDMLTEREAQIVAQLRQGFTNKEIARRLGIQEDTVKKHLQSVFGKLGVRRRALVVLGHTPPGRLSA